MGGCRCSYKNCLRATKNSDKDFHFFHYPAKDQERCLKWIANANKPGFQVLPEEQLRNKVVCQLHFEKQYFTNANMKRLVHDAVPTLDGGSQDNTTKANDMNVQVLQTDSEGNVFTVDTDTLMKVEVGEVQSYVIRNGNLVPADSPDPIAGTETDNLGDFEMNNKVDLLQTDMKHDYLEKNFELPVLTNKKTKSNVYVPHTPVYEVADPLGEAEKIQQSELMSSTFPQLQPLEEINVIEERECQHEQHTYKHSHQFEVKNITKTIEKHSKEIASLKRIINLKMKRDKFRKKLTTNQVINHLKGLIPSTLCGAISLHLLQKDHNFSKDEKNFLISLYTASPAAYNVLVKKCKWHLPKSHVVENLIVNTNGIR